MNKRICIFIGLLAAAWLPVHAQQSPQRFSIGRVEFTARTDRLEIRSPEQPPWVVDILPGGKYWPPIRSDERGRFFIGNKVMDTAEGTVREVKAGGGVLLSESVYVVPEDERQRFRIETPGRHCTVTLKTLGFGRTNRKSATELLADYNIIFTASDKKLLGLETHFDAAGGNAVSRRVTGIDPFNCQVLSRVNLGDPDMLVELGWSKNGGWWIVGSIEQTLLRSRDGKHWKKVPLSPDVYSMIGAYVASDKDIWLAAGLASLTGEDDPMVLHSPDGGKTWESLRPNDARLKLMPPEWLEGMYRGHSVEVQ